MIQLMPKARSYLWIEFGQEMNIGVVLEAGFITELAILSYLSQFH